MNSEDKPHVFLDGERICLCAMRHQDAETYARWLNDAELSSLLLMHRPLTLKQEYEIIEEMLSADPRSAVNAAVWLKDPMRLIGNIGLLKIDLLHRHAMIGIFIGDKRNWSKGYGSEAMSLLMTYGFNTLNLRKIWLGYFSHNERGRRAYEKLGFQETGRFREHRFVNGAWQDEVFMEVFREAFFDRKPQTDK